MIPNAIAGVSPDLTQAAPPARPPDFETCDYFYGRNLETYECYTAAAQLPQGNTSRGYGVIPHQYNPPPYLVLPFSIQEGGCYISVETAGPNISSIFQIVPNDLRSRAASIIQRCVIGQHGLGGFATHQFANMFGFLQDPDYVSGVTPIPATTAFITITVSGPEAKLSAPGDKDKQIAVELAGIFEGKSYHLEEEDKMDEAVSNAKLAKEYLNLAANMTQNGRPRGIPSWWYPLTTPPTTTPIESDVKYECDAQLGSPAPNDCTYIQSQDLGPDSDTIEIKPGAVIFLHQNTCNTAITSSIDLILTWEQVRVALAALVAACVLQPSKWSHGGRAFYEPHPVKRRRGHDRKRDPSLLNALPPHANITLFQQKEAWRGPSVEQDSCTWKAVMRGVSITTCSAT